ncbi:MAG: tetratricopeptide repeat protein, partial [Flavobacteriales bacterium]
MNKEMKRFWIHILLFSFCLGYIFPLYGQKSAEFTHLTEYKTAEELYDKQKYNAAQKKYEEAIEKINDPNHQISIASKYKAAQCALKLYNEDAKKRLKRFISEYPESPKINSAKFQLANYNYRKSKYNDAIHWYDQVNEQNLEDKEVTELKFKKGYSFFESDSFVQASKLFYQIKDKETPYYSPANYYYAHIAYNDEKFQTALESFQKLEDHKKFGKIVPYYITQIYYKQEKYPKLIEYASPLFESSNPERKNEIARLLGNAYYRTSQYEKAVPYLKKFNHSGYGKSREDKFQLGFAYYKSGKYEKAIKAMKPMTRSEDSIAQLAYYHLGNTYLKQGEKEYAMRAFRSASNLRHDKKIRQQSLFNYAKLAYETSYNPYNQAVRVLRKYIEEYPETPEAIKAKEYLVNVFMSTKNYKTALRSLEEIQEKKYKLKTAHQIVAFNRGVQLFQDNNLGQAIKTFDKANKYKINRKLNAKSLYWKAEAYFNIGRYKKAIEAYNKFRDEPGAFLLKKYKLAYYGLGFSHFKIKQYEKAATEFRNFVDNAEGEFEKKVADAYLRIGDSYYIQKKYLQAIEYYHKGSKHSQNGDYGLFQKAVCLGLTGKKKKKAKTLKKFLSKYDNSKYNSEVKYNLARHYFTEKEYDKAFELYDEIVKEYPNSSFARKSRMEKGLIHYKQNKNKKALRSFKESVKEAENYNEAEEALQRIKSIYVSMDKIKA